MHYGIDHMGRHPAPPAKWSMSGRYASYWNAFLLYKDLQVYCEILLLNNKTLCRINFRLRTQGLAPPVHFMRKILD